MGHNTSSAVRRESAPSPPPTPSPCRLQPLSSPAPLAAHTCRAYRVSRRALRCRWEKCHPPTRTRWEMCCVVGLQKLMRTSLPLYSTPLSHNLLPSQKMAMALGQEGILPAVNLYCRQALCRVPSPVCVLVTPLPQPLRTPSPALHLLAGGVGSVPTRSATPLSPRLCVPTTTPHLERSL